ncbi:hypothetical protein BGX23_010598 [Mortierella sp. AD031]|nr:hypothetical protein BGX23_010598 [Mortierella sp. AD031]KAG0218339.1 hypothetical protein BGX33_007664 [Mortierella sp. NVP41]
MTYRRGEQICLRSTAYSYTSYDKLAAIVENRKVINYTGNEFYRFRYTDTSVHCSHLHPQLRNLVYATSKNDVYYLYDNSIHHWSPQLRSSKTILGRPLKNLHSRIPNRITTMAAMDEFMMVGGEDGSFTFMNLRTCENPVYDSFTTEHFLEVNGIEITRSRTGTPLAYMSSNDHIDHQLRCLDLTTLQVSATFPTAEFVNFASQSPDGHMLTLVGDEVNGQVMSVNSREKIATLKGHQRFCFSVAWSPDSRMLATGSDDRSTCIFDTRMLADPVHILSRDIQESVRSLRYSSCGRYLAMAEDRHYVHIVDTTTDYSQAQKIDFVGDISGISFTPDGEGLYIGVSSIDFSSLLEFEKIRPECAGSDKNDQFSSFYF